MKKINIGRLWYPVNTLGYGKRLGVWFQGCRKNCNGCLSPEFQSEEENTLYTANEILETVSECEKIDGLTISGGEPFDQEEGLLELIRLFSERYTKDILVYTGYTIEELQDKKSETIGQILKNIAVLIDGTYIEEKNGGVGLMGSSNQNIHVFRYKERYADAKFQKREFQCVLLNDRLWLIGIPPK